MRVIVTGASGFVGSHVLAGLVERAEVHAVARHAGIAPAVRWHECDLFDDDRTRVTLERIRATHLIHLPWCTEPGLFWNSAANVDWLQHSLNLVRAFIASGGMNVIVAGSCAEYRWSGEHCREDATPLSDETLYALSKNALHAICTSLCEQAGVRLAWGRIFYAYGVGEARGRFLSSAARAIARGEAIELREADRRLDYVHVRDVAAAFAMLSESQAEGSYNIGSGEGRTVRSMIKALATAASREPKVTHELGAVKAPDVVADIEKMRALGWAPLVPFEEGVAGLWRVGGGT